MPSKQNVSDLSEIKQRKDKAKSVVFVHYRGLTSNNINELRRKIKEAGGELLIFKNTLLRIAFENQDLSQSLTGPTAAIFAYEDEVAPLKIVADFAKTTQLPELTAAYLDEKFLSAEAVKQLAKLPGKLELRAKVIGTMAAPLYGLVNVLQGNIRKIVYTISAIKDKKGKE
jgi:large subunit ribosomal protein L10